MKTTSYRARALGYTLQSGTLKGALCALLASTAYCGLTAQPAQAQTSTKGPIPAERYTISPGGVDMRTGQYVYSNRDLAIGGDAGLALVRDNGLNEIRPKPFGDFAHNWDIFISQNPDSSYSPDTGLSASGYIIVVNAGGRSHTFTTEYLLSNPSLGSGDSYATLTGTGTTTARQYIFTAADGTVINFRPLGSSDCRPTKAGMGIRNQGSCAYASQVVQPDGARFDLQYDAAPTGGARLRRVTSNRGHALILEYASPTGDKLVSRACAINLAVQAAPAVNSCPAGVPAATYTYQSDGHLASYTDPTGRTFNFSYGFDSAVQATRQRFFRPGETSPYLINDLGSMGAGETLKQVFADGRTYNYAWNEAVYNEFQSEIAGGSYTRNDGATVTVGFDKVVTYGSKSFQISPGPSLIRDELGRTTTGNYCQDLGNGCAVLPILNWTLPEGNRIDFTYDGYRNVRERREKAKPGSGLPDIVTAATYNCTSAVLCAKPTATMDANGNVTDYTYDPTHGGVLTETGPAVNGVRPQKRYSYEQRYAWVSDGAGGYVRAASPVWLLTRTSVCKTGAASGGGCANAGDEVVTTYDYGPDAGPNNLQLRGIVVDAGGLNARTCYGYDAQGNRTSETGANASRSSCQ